jgi:hypothetical protein
MAKIDKLIVTNVQALRSKYGTRGLAEISAAVDAMIAADAARGLMTRLIDLSSRATRSSMTSSATPSRARASCTTMCSSCRSGESWSDAGADIGYSRLALQSP